jgi:UDP-N-acetylglucosamine--N-acetylmuramyl-(pentapeptide) pyrophosphoryl-undecaprenol N-acetylglucosamine transferase
MQAHRAFQPGNRVLFTGGGTAGHVNPALAVWHALRHIEPAIRAMWIGSDRIESRLVPAAGMDFRQIDIRFSYRRFGPSNFHYYRKHILPLLLGKPFRQARFHLEGLTPDLVVATGGYVSAPVIFAAQRQGIPVALIEINSPPGVVNWFFSERCWRVYSGSERITAGFDGRCAAYKVKTCGIPALAPVRNRQRVCHDYGINPRRRILLAMGGSLGAGAVHRAVRELLNAAAASSDMRWRELAVINVAGERASLREEQLNSHGLPRGPVSYHETDYMEDVTGALAASDFYLGRSGAATVGELIASGLQSLLIPDPQHADRQQYGNAQELVSRGQGEIMDQPDICGPAVLGWLERAWDAPRIQPPEPPAAEQIAGDLLEVLGR